MARKKTKFWRPAKEIKAKVIGICINNGKLLAMDIYDDAGAIKGVRPLGGVIELGETRDAALKREFLEELGTQIMTAGTWRCFENIYNHEGELGHEYVFAIGISFVNQLLYQKEIIAFSEDSGYESKARWIDIDDLKAGKTPLFPNGLLEKL